MFADDADYHRTQQGDRWRIGGVREAIAAGATRVMATTDAENTVVLTMDLQPRERAVLLAGGMLAYLCTTKENPFGVVKGDSEAAENGVSLPVDHPRTRSA